MNEPLDYRSTGVDLKTYEETISRLPPLMRRTFTPRVIEWKDGFAGLFRLDDQIGLLSRTYRDPVLVASTDGVGTKLKVAFATGRHSTVGIDLVAMSVNDCLCAGAEPLLFLDYVAMNRDDPELTTAIVKGVSDGCIEAECALLGGETAILPDLYKEGEYDLAGFCVGVVERKHILDGRDIRPGDKVVGLASSGLHSNGYSLARKIVFDHAGLAARDLRRRAGPHRRRRAARRPPESTSGPSRSVYRNYRVKRDRARHRPHHRRRPDRQPPAHPSRRLRHPPPPRLVADPPRLPLAATTGPVDQAEMDRVFNMGIGLVVVVAEHFADAIVRRLNSRRVNVPAWIIGEVVPGEKGVVWS